MKFAGPEPNVLAGGPSNTSTSTSVVRCIGDDVGSVAERQNHQDPHQAETGAAGCGLDLWAQLVRSMAKKTPSVPGSWVKPT